MDDNRHGERSSQIWSENMRTHTRDERAEMEEARRAAAAYMTVQTYREMIRQNELAHGDLTARFLASKGAKEDG